MLLWIVRLFRHNVKLSIGAAVVFFLLLWKKFNWFRLYCMIVTIPRDVHIIYRAGKSVLTQHYWQYKGYSVARIFQKHVAEDPDQIAFRHLDSKWTFREVEEWSNQLSRLFLGAGIKRGDCVALFMEGKPEYPCIWLALSKIGVVTSLINTNQTGVVLQRCIELCKAKWIVYGTELTSALEEIQGFLVDMKKYHYGEGKALIGSLDLKSEAAKEGKTPLQEEILKCKYTDQMLYVYTSGTTGLPKAAVVTHARYCLMAYSVVSIVNLSRDDVVYDPLPLYHTAGGTVGVGQAFIGGSTVVIRSKFSASNFFKDCIKYECTAAQYIGETCRYLLNTPESPTDTAHKVRVIFGNGIKAQVWQDFVKRFKIKGVVEFYGATEGNASIVNAWDKIGSVGYVPWIVSSIYPVRLIRVDEDTNEPIRGADGLCISCEPGEPGLLIGKIIKNRPTSHFNGYQDKEATNKKVIHNVFRMGDSFFNSGDILVKDDYGYYYFKDRTGDTFRWRGENVATTEVEGIISEAVGHKETTVYGVEIPNVEGKAGMATIVSEKLIDFETLLNGMKRLPAYARPLFVRIAKTLPLTGTFKVKKNVIQKEGYNPKTISDPLFFYDQRNNKFLPLDEQLYSDIVTNVVKL